MAMDINRDDPLVFAGKLDGRCRQVVSRRLSLAARASVVALLATVGLVVPAVPARAEPPPEALPEAASLAHKKWQPAMDYDANGCYPTPAIGPDGSLNEGLNNTGDPNGACRDESDLENVNVYARSRCDQSGWCAHMYYFYFQKDQAVPGPTDEGGHRHDWESVVVWVRHDQIRFVSASGHGEYEEKPAGDFQMEGTHPKIVYHKEGGSTHAFRFAEDGEVLANHKGTWQYPDVVSWNGYPPGIRTTLLAADWGGPSFGLKDQPNCTSLDDATKLGVWPWPDTCYVRNLMMSARDRPDADDFEFDFNSHYVAPGAEDPNDPYTNRGVGDPTETHPGGDDGGAKPPTGAHHTCRPDGMTPTAGVTTPYCDVYDSEGREWLGQGRSRRVIGYFNGGRTGADGTPHYLVKNIPWSKVTHINYAFAQVKDNRISVGPVHRDNPSIGMTWPGIEGAEMDPSLGYQGHFNLLHRYKELHPRVKTLISVGGWAESRGFYTMTTNSDGTVNQDGIKTFADSVVDFLRDYEFDGVDIDYEYPTMLDDTGNPNDWDTARSRRPGLPASYTALMRTLREKLDQAAAADGRYYLLTSASSASGYLVRGMANQKALRYQDFTNLMSYDFHGTWNDVVGPNAPLYDDGEDVELEELYETPEYDGIGYFNTDWAFHYLRGAMQAGRINIGIPYYTRGWRGVMGGDSGMWGSSVGADCQPGTGIVRPCGNGAVGIDNIWHDRTTEGEELGAGVNPMWHAKNLEKNVMPGYADNVRLTPDDDPSDEIKGEYVRHWDDTTKTSWLWNESKDVFLSTFDTEGVDAVADYVIDKGAGGVMMWELGGDYDCPVRVTGQDPCGLGYTMTNRLHERLTGAGAYGASRNAGSAVTMPPAAVDVTADLVDYGATATDLWPMQPTLRITNNTSVAVGGGKDVALRFDLPTSTPPLVKDGNWQTWDQGGRWQVEAGHTGPNAGGGLRGDFHRVGVKLDYCQIIPPGKSLDIPIIYYLPATGPVNTTLTVGTQRFALLPEHNRGSSRTAPPAGGCAAPAWDRSKVYNPATQPIEQTTVKYGGKVWQAKWWTQGNIPGTGPDADHEPWKLIGPAN